MGTSATNGARRRQWIAPRRFWRNAVRGRAVAASNEKRVHKKPSPMPARGLTVNGRARRAVLDVGREISRRNSGSEAHSTHDNFSLACFRSRGGRHSLRGPQRRRLPSDAGDAVHPGVVGLAPRGLRMRLPPGPVRGAGCCCPARVTLRARPPHTPADGAPLVQYPPPSVFTRLIACLRTFPLEGLRVLTGLWHGSGMVELKPNRFAANSELGVVNSVTLPKPTDTLLPTVKYLVPSIRLSPGRFSHHVT